MLSLQPDFTVSYKLVELEEPINPASNLVHVLELKADELLHPRLELVERPALDFGIPGG